MATTLTGNWAQDAAAVFKARTWALSDKEDTGAPVAESDLDTYFGAALANTMLAQWRIAADVANGDQAINALDIAGALSVGGGGTASATADDIVCGTTTNDGSAHGMTVLSHSSQSSRYLAGTEGAGGRTGGLIFTHSASRWSVECTAGSSAVRFEPTIFYPGTDNTVASGGPSNRWTTVRAYDGDFADDVTVGDALTVGGSSVSFTEPSVAFVLGAGNGSPSQQFQKSGAGTTTMEFRATSSLTSGARRIQHSTGELLNLDSYNGATWDTVVSVGASQTLSFFGGTPVAKPEVTGSAGGNAALQSLLTALDGLNLITDSST